MPDRVLVGMPSCDGTGRSAMSGRIVGEALTPVTRRALAGAGTRLWARAARGRVAARRP